MVAVRFGISSLLSLTLSKLQMANEKCQIANLNKNPNRPVILHLIVAPVAAAHGSNAAIFRLHLTQSPSTSYDVWPCEPAKRKAKTMNVTHLECGACGL